jgi:hypothetical protein
LLAAQARPRNFDMSATRGPATALDKIRSEQLRREAATTPSESHVVVVELNLPRPKIEKIEVIGRNQVPGREARFRVAPDASDSAEAESRVSKAREAIEKIIGKPPEQFFPSSGAFVVTATGKQLQELVKLPDVAAIWPNTRT